MHRMLRPTVDWLLAWLRCHLIPIIQTDNLVASERTGLEWMQGKSLCPDCGLVVFALRIVSAGVKVKDPGETKDVFQGLRTFSLSDPQLRLLKNGWQNHWWAFFKHLLYKDFWKNSLNKTSTFVTRRKVWNIWRNSVHVFTSNGACLCLGTMLMCSLTRSLCLPGLLTP